MKRPFTVLTRIQGDESREFMAFEHLYFVEAEDYLSAQEGPKADALPHWEATVLAVWEGHIAPVVRSDKLFVHSKETT